MNTVRRIPHCSPIHAVYFSDTIHAEVSHLDELNTPAREIFMEPDVWQVLAEVRNWRAVQETDAGRTLFGVPVTVRSMPTAEVIVVGRQP